ncbi:hypothetical protein F4553_007647 [Allocatelliglobosispora scoriae]|uniref:TIR domain-containing protein n=1 Tax=Allocatelliglobosispora scoriae TaxID=643052 RepID=A0A841C4Z5_9ACTN|nr:toll/interleukin-1 receptor domain-containing protein [Allocatelliglobosispora scoriae]MBB5874213.1 hypothetical protein [Allocatelliglobosispora scoriae]
MTGHVFISYSHAHDGPYVEKLTAYLVSAGVPVWYDKEIISGTRWHEVIKEQIDTCSVLIVVMSPAAEESQWVNRELNQAELRGKPILPLLLRGDRFFRLSDVQYDDVEGGRMPSDEYLRLLPRNAPPPGTELPTPAVVGEAADELGGSPSSALPPPAVAQRRSVWPWVGRGLLWLGVLFFTCGEGVAIHATVTDSWPERTGALFGNLFYAIPFVALLGFTLFDLRRIRHRRRTRQG